uniref:30S ribosomal protein 3, chloroplastic n=1 Tax=Dictyopteris divaricata TaxID=156996 RepID=A0A2I4Q2M4_9PHAE|nr:putative plastid-specific 30S ribosomal protein [Dictyopteris divaricata]YP_010205386.1 putative plastid-specific 30S ribosomal protein [Grateloupia livida]AQZ25097.1 putative plastid-specific 30S ribosomal protein [Dictyopteris divaricata]UAV85955.1 putative plastid-specific 30S ribosomal protein [Grateloupia livida]
MQPPKKTYLFKAIWGKNSIGLAVEKRLRENITSPVTTYFFWPSENGWKLLKNELYNKPWVTDEERVELLNGYNKIIKYWLKNVTRNDEIIKLLKDSEEYNFELSGINSGI